MVKKKDREKRKKNKYIKKADMKNWKKCVFGKLSFMAKTLELIQDSKWYLIYYICTYRERDKKHQKLILINMEINILFYFRDILSMLVPT